MNARSRIVSRRGELARLVGAEAECWPRRTVGGGGGGGEWSLSSGLGCDADGLWNALEDSRGDEEGDEMVTLSRGDSRRLMPSLGVLLEGLRSTGLSVSDSSSDILGFGSKRRERKETLELEARSFMTLKVEPLLDSMFRM